MTETRGQALEGHGGHAFGGGSARRDTRHSPGMSVELESGTTAASEARAALAALEGSVDREVLDDIRLLVSELVTNSVRHSGAEAGRSVGLSVSSRGDAVRVEVSDAGTGFEPRPRTEDQSKGSGWGLHLVEHLADRWGVETGRRTRVWFEIDR